jgi:serine protease Do
MSISVLRATLLVSALAIGLAGPSGAADQSLVGARAPGVVVVGATGTVLPGFADIVRRVSPAVVSLITTKGLGSGFVIDEQGFIVTNSHVIQSATEAEVRFADGTRYKARLIGKDEETDIAVMKIDAPKTFPVVRFADDKDVRVGDWILAVGNPFGLGGTVTAGIVSARGRDQIGSGQFTDYLQVDAAINPGNSGGPTFDTAGRVIGMNTIAVSSRAGSGIGFALPSSTIQRVVADLKSSGTVSRGYVGVQIAALSDDAATALGLPNSNGALVTGVVEGSPAEAGGFRQGDVVLSMNGQSVRDNRELSRRIAALQVGQTATFTVWRDNKQITITVTVARRAGVASTPAPELKLSSLGIAMSTVTDSMRTTLALSDAASGVLITDVDLASDAAIRGLKAGDRIVAVGGTKVDSLTDINLAIEQARALKRTMVLLFVENQRGGKRDVPVKLVK